MTSDLLEENQDLRKQVAELEKELKAEKEYSATLRKEIDEYTNSHTLCVKYKELEKENAKLQARIDDWQSEYIELENFKNNEIEKLEDRIEQLENDLEERNDYD